MTPVCFIKFGESEFMNTLANGDFFFSHAKRFAEIEENEFIKGQGDLFEGKAELAATSARVYSLDDDSLIANIKLTAFTLSAEYVPYKPVYCLSVFDVADCVEYIDEKNYKLIFSTELVTSIKSHFPKADTAVVFTDPRKLIESLLSGAKSDIQHGYVNYFNMHPVDLEWVKFVHDNKGEKVDGGIRYTMLVENSYKLLFCKDLFFKEEKEYRFVYSNDSIRKPEVRRFEIGGQATIKTMDELFNSGLNVVNGAVKNIG
ncbi:hypothetical protein [Bacteroides sp.]|uniref:hypothetical protein n=1 Tax=Bacteroides sp. TaxID=29523 RepID=UPI002633739B|nr:hypothetical protein [Bacteroides sp.]MDD3041069.1 hypothetical protein [Bacteroides sp.]